MAAALIVGACMVPSTMAWAAETDENALLYSFPVISSVQPVEAEGINMESNRQGDKEYSGEKITLTLGACETSWELTNAVDAYNAKNGKYY